MSEITTPDTMFNRVLSGVLAVASSLYLLVLLVGMVWRRKHQPVASRSSVLLLFQAFASIVIMGLSLSRIAIGRSVFPCPLYAFLWITVIPSYFTPMILIALRIWILDTANRLKSHIRNLRSSSFPEDDRGLLLADQKSDSETASSDLSPKSVILPDISHKSSTAERVLFAFRVLGSEKMLGLINLAVILFHTIEWGLVVAFSSDLHRLDGCGWSMSMFVSLGVSFFFYGFLVVVGALLIVRIRDGFGMWIEFITCIAFYLVGLIVFAVALLWDGYDLYVEQHFWPSLNFVLFIMLGTNTLRLGVPVIVSIVWQRYSRTKNTHQQQDWAVQLEEQKSPASTAQQATETELNMPSVLSGKETLAAFQSYCNREFSSENILCWIDVQKYKKTANSSKRLAFARNIEDLYIREGGPLAVNINNELRIQISNELTQANPRLFDGLESVLQAIMSDTFSRFMSTREYSQLLHKQRKQGVVSR